MSRATSGFLAGLVSGGLGTYLKVKDVERADAKEKRDQETFDYLKDQREREQATQRRTDAAIQDYAGLADGVVDTNTSGFSPSQVTQLMKQGGQAAVDAQASRIADAEMAAGGAPSKVSSMLPNFNDPSGAPVQGAPTVTTRQATPVDRAAAFEKIAIAKGDVAGIEKAAQAKQKAIWDAEDMEAVKAVMADPNGEATNRLLGMIRQSIPGADIALDPKTGMYVGMIADKPVNLSPAQLGQLAVVERQISRGDPNALTTLAGIDKDLAGAGAGIWKTQVEMAKFNNEAIQGGATIQQNATRTGLAVNADKRAGQAHGVTMAEKGAELAGKAAEGPVRVAELLRTNPNAAPGQIAAAQTGQLDPFKPQKEGNWQFDSGDINAVLSRPVVGPSGRALLDQNGRTIREPDPERLNAMLEFMQRHNIRDTNEGLQKFLVYERQTKPSGATRKPQNVTPADIAATAKKYGISEAEVRKQLGL